MKPWPSKNVTPEKLNPSPASRDIVHVTDRDSRSTWLDCSCAKRAAGVAGRYFTCSESPKIAAESARQKSTSSPDHLPAPSGAKKPGKFSPTPQLTKPRSRTLSSVAAEATEQAKASA